jgi:hypothetical protein
MLPITYGTSCMSFFLFGNHSCYCHVKDMCKSKNVKKKSTKNFNLEPFYQFHVDQFTIYNTSLSVTNKTQSITGFWCPRIQNLNLQ